MSIRKCDSLISSEHVLNIVQNCDDIDKIDCLVECYQNGREQGFILWGFRWNKTALYFANHRNSDEIVIYEGKYAMQGVSEDAYRNKYQSKSHEDAAQRLIYRSIELSKKPTA